LLIGIAPIANRVRRLHRNGWGLRATSRWSRPRRTGSKG
jgi:hypothetical protein